MLLKGLAYMALAGVAALLPSVAAAGQSTFVSADKGLAFAFSAPEVGNEAIYFSIRLKKEYSWGAVGLGSEDMRGALYLVIYQNAQGDNVTFSPRLGYSHMEPAYYDGLKYEVLNGTGIRDGYLYFSARCLEKCRGWPSNGKTKSYIDVTSPSQPAIYALGPRQDFASDSPSANLKFHHEVGTFEIDMKRTHGSEQLPSFSDESVTDGTTMRTRTTGKTNWRTTVHAVFMIISFVGAIPLGVVLVRVPAWKKWHGVAQTTALVLVIIGFAMGIVTGSLFQKSHRNNSYHQVIGILVMTSILIQWGLGFLHHRNWDKAQLPTIYGSIHVWLGRGILFFAILNAFLGFVFAQNRRLSLFLGLALLFMSLSYTALFLTRRWLGKRQPQTNARPLIQHPHYHSPQDHPGLWRDGSQTPWSERSSPLTAVPSTTSLTRAASFSYRAPTPQYKPQHFTPAVELDLNPTSPWKNATNRSHKEAIELDATQMPAELV
ncbi:hypothetical protein HJFPF1_03717 [Paramyrothecium foliicola]|nr:hypothetical protein HJFPF1_03717 [Paramyrothecium foliicola]